MSREDFIAIGTRLFAVYLGLTVSWEAVRSAGLVFQDGWTSHVIFMLLLWVLALMVCGLLWVFPLTVARKLLPVMREPRSEQRLDASVALSLGLTLIGVWVLAYAVVNAAYWLTLFVRTHRLGLEGYDWTPDQVAGIAATVVELAVGLWLVFGSVGLKRLLYRFRYGPEAPTARPDDAA